MKGKARPKVIPIGGIRPQPDVNWLRVDFDEGGKPEFSEKNPDSESVLYRLKLNPHTTRGQGCTRVTELGGAVDNR